MARYKWDLEELRHNKKVLMDLLEKHPETKDDISKNINMYSMMLKAAAGKNIYKDINEDDIPIFDWNYFIEKGMDFYQDDNPDFIDIVTGSYGNVYNKFNKDIDNNYSVALTNEDLLFILEDFFKNKVDRDSYEIFKRTLSMNKANNYLNITHSKNSLEQDNVVLFDDTLRKQYINITRHNDLFDLVAMPHEFFHFIFDDGIPKVRNYNMRYLNEMSGILANLLFSEYYIENADRILTDSYDENGVAYDDKLFFKNHFLGIYTDQVESFIIKNEMLNSIKRNGELRVKKFNRSIKKYNIVDPEKDYVTLLKYLLIDEETALTYALSYLTAIDLFYQIQNDKERGFYNLRKLRECYDINDIINYIRFRGITFMDDNYKNLKEYTKKMTN